MSSHARPCYQVLSQYTQNGINPIIAPTPAETEPEILAYFSPRKFGQKDYELHKKMYMTSNIESSNNISNCIGYSSYSQIGCGRPNGERTQFSNKYEFEPGVNEVSIKSVSVARGHK